MGSKSCPLAPKVASKLYNSACIPKLLYGLEIAEVDDSVMDKLESFHSHNAKMFQGLPDNTSNVGSLGTIGWSSIEAKLDIMRMLFLWRILLLPMSYLYKMLIIRLIMTLLEDISSLSINTPTASMLKTCHKYGVLHKVINAICTSKYESISEWKRYVRNIVLCQDLKRWKIKCHLYKSLDLYKFALQKNGIMSAWWYYVSVNPEDCNKVRLLFKLLLNCFRLGKETCIFCNDQSRDSLQHILFDCQHGKEKRQYYWDMIMHSCLPILYKDILLMDSHNKCTFILNAFYVDYTLEWNEFYRRCLYFVYNIYMDYYNSQKLHK